MVEGEAVCARPAHRAPRDAGGGCGLQIADWQMSERTKVPIIEPSSSATAYSESRTCRLYKHIGDMSRTQRVRRALRTNAARWS